METARGCSRSSWNLLSNAVKFTEDGGRVRVRLRRVPAAAEITVSDDGVGIPAEFLPWVFEPFRQADASSTRRHGGLGLGLSIVKHLVEAHGGTIVAFSEGEGQGATFTVRLPIRLNAAADASTIALPILPGQSPDALSGLCVLLLDDDPDSCEIVAACLTSRHATVLTATSPSQALELLQRERVDLLLSDIAMPGEDGYSFIKRVRALSPRYADMPAAALTALARDEDRERALRAGFQMHLPKPIDGHSLIAAVVSLRRHHGAYETN